MYYIYIYMYYISVGPFKPHQAVKSMLPATCHKSFQSFPSQVDSEVFNRFHSFPVLKSAIVSLQVWYQL